MKIQSHLLKFDHIAQYSESAIYALAGTLLVSQVFMQSSYITTAVSIMVLLGESLLLMATVKITPITWGLKSLKQSQQQFDNHMGSIHQINTINKTAKQANDDHYRLRA